MEKTATISRCEKYRYKLTRTWDEKKGKVLFIMLNPSTANHIENDLTTIRCINFAEKWGYGGIMIGNIYPFRAKRPKDLRKWLNEIELDLINEQCLRINDFLQGMFRGIEIKLIDFKLEFGK